ncbi:hypothetical protein Celaphus_00011310, partial [Cervus elaphus hippelaphus]
MSRAFWVRDSLDITDGQAFIVGPQWDNTSDLSALGFSKTHAKYIAYIISQFSGYKRNVNIVETREIECDEVFAGEFQKNETPAFDQMLLDREVLLRSPEAIAAPVGPLTVQKTMPINAVDPEALGFYFNFSSLKSLATSSSASGTKR